MSILEHNLKIAQANPNRNANRRCGFSLIELMLVMAIMLFVAALALPAAQRMFSRQALGKAAGLLRAEMGQARVKSIKTGEIYAVYYVPGYAWHSVAPFANAREQASIATRRAQESKQRSSNEPFADDLLPRGVIFVAGEAMEDARSAQAVADLGGSVSSVKMVLFYPDGTSQDARIYLQNEKNDLRLVELRGLTGTATSRKIEGLNR